MRIYYGDHLEELEMPTLAHFRTVMLKLTRLVASRKLARRKERNLALAKGKHGLKRPK